MNDTTPNKSEQQHWFVAVVGNKSEKKTAERLTRYGFECYVPIQEERHVFADGTRKTIDHVLFSAKIFIHATEKQRREIVKDPGIFRFLVNKAANPTEHGFNPVAVIPDSQIEHLKLMLQKSLNPVSIDPSPLRRGDVVRVVSGELAGLEGVVRKTPAGESHIYISLAILGSASTRIDASSLEVIQKSQEKK